MSAFIWPGNPTACYQPIEHKNTHLKKICTPIYIVAFSTINKSFGNHWGVRQMSK